MRICGRRSRNAALSWCPAANALTARIIESPGFEAAYVTGAGIANTQLGVPDIGLVTLTELVGTTAAIAEISSLPLITDIDTGFGNPINAYRTVRVLERAGAAALQIEDQAFPKKCGHFAGKTLISAREMVAKLKAALDARDDANLLIIARTDVRASEGVDRALDRAATYAEAGADLTFVEAPVSEGEMTEITRRLAVPHVANMVVGGRTPLVAQARLAELGFAVVLYANAALQASIRAMNEVLGSLRREGGLDAVMDRLADFEERQRVVNKEAHDALEQRYAMPERGSDVR